MRLVQMANAGKTVLARIRKPGALFVVVATWATILGVLATYILPDFSPPPLTRQSLRQLRLDGVTYRLTTGYLNLDARDVDVQFVATASMPWADLVSPRPKGRSELLTGPHVFETVSSAESIPVFVDKGRVIPGVPNSEVGAKIGSKWEETGHPRVKVFGDPRYYPFDEYYLIGWIGMPAYVKWEDGTVYSLNNEEWESVFIENRDSRFVLSLVGSDEFVDEFLRPNEFLPELFAEARDDARSIPWNSRNYFAVKLSRPEFLKVLAVVFLIAGVLWLLYLGLSKEESPKGVDILAYLAALWVVRDIISARTEAFPTLVDYTVLILYVAAILVVFTRAVMSWARKSLDRVDVVNRSHPPRPRVGPRI